MNLIDAFEAGRVSGFGMPDRVIRSAMSRVFLFSDRAVKVYGYHVGVNGDLGDMNFRRAFYEEDFFWNHAASPEVYGELTGVRWGADEFQHAPHEDAQDFYISISPYAVPHSSCYA